MPNRKIVVRRAIRPCLVVLLGAIFLSSCTVTFTGFTAPPAVAAGAVFEVLVTATTGNSISPGDQAVAVLALPNGFVVESSAATLAGAAVLVQPAPNPTAAALFVPEPGTTLWTFSGTASYPDDDGVLRVLVRAPAQVGTYTLKVALVTSTFGTYQVNYPSGQTNFAAIGGAAARVVDVIQDESSMPRWSIGRSGLPVASSALQRQDGDVADVDGDGIGDLLAGIALPSGNPLTPIVFGASLARGRMRQGFGASAALGPQNVHPRGNHRFLYFDGDGDQDVLANFTLSMNTGGSFAPAVAVALPFPLFTSSSNYFVSSAVGDIDGDGDDDFACSGPAPAVFLANGATPTMTLLPASAPFATYGTHDLVFADIDLDGDLDLVAGGQGIEIRRNDGAGNFAVLPPLALPVPSNEVASSLAVGDIDGDGDRDIVAATRIPWGVADGTLRVYRNVGGSFVSASIPGLPTDAGVTAVALADLDLDGAIELVMGRAGYGYNGVAGIEVLSNAGAGFVPSAGVSSGLTSQGLGRVHRFVVEDIDADGTLDIAAFTPFGTEVFLNARRVQATTYGRVGSGLGGGALPLLFVNGSAGDSVTGAVQVGLNQPITVSLAQSPTYAFPSRYVLWGRLGLATAAGVVAGTLGNYPFLPQHFAPGDPALFTIANTFVVGDPLALLPYTPPGSFTATHPPGFAVPATLTLYAIVDEPSAPYALAPTNSVIVDVR